MTSDLKENWVFALAEFLRQETGVEALLVDPDKKKISIATIGPIDELQLTQKVQETILAIERSMQAGTFLSKSLPGSFKMSKRSGQTLLEKPSCHTAPVFWKWRTVPWPKIEKDEEHEEDWRVLAILAGLCGIFALSGAFVSHFSEGPHLLPILLYSLAMITGGWDAAHDTLHKIPKGELDIHFLMLAVAIGSALIGAWGEGALLLFLFSFSGALEHFALHRTKSAIDALFKASPKQALVLKDGQEVLIPIEKVVPGDIVIVKPGDRFPVDAEVIAGESAADESNITGEANPVDKKRGSSVFGGTINLWGVLKAQVTKAASESALQKIIQLIHEAKQLKAPSQRFTDRFGTPYTYFILSATVMMFFIWWLGFGIAPFSNTESSFSAFYRAMTLLVVASPCAIVISIPSAILAAIAWGARHGILFKGGAAIEKLASVDLVALDKTGTLTTGDLSVYRIESFPPGRENKIIELAYSLEKNANHPIARAITQYGHQKNLDLHVVERFQSLIGLGVQGNIDNKLCILGQRELLEMGPLSSWANQLPQPSPEYIEIWLIYDDTIGRILLKDEIRKKSIRALQLLNNAHLKTVMLTGDRRETAESIGSQLGINEVRAALKPEGKVAAIREFSEKGYKVAMVGDGVNDAPSLAAAYVSVAMGARGSDAAIEQSEVILMNDRIENFYQAFHLSIQAKRVIRQNIAISLATIVVMVVSAVFGIVPITLGVFAHEGSTVLVSMNSLRLLFLKQKVTE